MNNQFKGPYVIVEGADGSGKTTLAKYLTEYFFTQEAAFCHSGPPQLPTRQFLELQLKQNENLTIFDRFHVGSYVYGTVFRGVDDMTPFDHWQLEGSLYARGSIMVFCNPSTFVLDEVPADKDASLYENPEKQAAVRQEYRNYAERMTHLPTIYYDRSKIEVSDITRVAESLINVTLLAKGVFKNVAYLGNSIAPKAILVGDRHSKLYKYQDRAKQLGVSYEKYLSRLRSRGLTGSEVFDSVSGRYLFLTMAKERFTNYGIVNSMQLDGTDTFKYLLDTYGDNAIKKYRYVALGQKASDRLRQNGIQHVTVSHPAYRRRVAYKDILEYRSILREAMYGTK